MAIKYEKIQPGMVLWSKERRRMGNTTIRQACWFAVHIKEMMPEKRTALVSWNGNTPTVYSERSLKKLYAKKLEGK